MDYLRAFLVGGTICLIGQLLMDKTKLTPARILVIFVTSGVILGGLGVYKPIAEYGGAGASVPLPGFGYSLAKGAINDVDQYGLIGAFTGGIKATAAGIAAAIFFGYIMALIFNPKTKS
jgi:stage V sporulation protein AE